MENENEVKAGKAAKFSLTERHSIFFLLLIGLIVFAVVRSSVATRLDAFTFDEAYHIGAGAAYVQTGDFRLNPEHPPLVKLWVGAFVTAAGFQLSPYRAFADKGDERDFVEEDVYMKNDTGTIQKQARRAMFALNALLLFLFALAARGVFGDVMALAATAYLVIDPTVAAHLPVVMTDLPVALASAIAVLSAVQAFRSWRAVDLIFAALALGLALGAKHSAVITMIAVALIGFVAAIFSARGAAASVRLRRAGAVAAVLIGAVVVLWSFYLFRFGESPQAGGEQFNRPLATKISDVRSPVYRAGLNLMANGRLFPRAYTWGMADTIRAGAEGRAIPVLAFGGLYYNKAPFYFFAGMLAAKLPLGLLLLTVIGAVFLARRKFPREFAAPLLGSLVLAILFLIFLARGSSYAGVRHALPVVPVLALLAALAVRRAVELKSNLLGGAVAVCLIAALASAIPLMRPWEYFNEIAGGTREGYLYFNDEGVDLSQRTREMAEYYKTHLEPNGELPFVAYFSPAEERRRWGLDWVGNKPERDGERIKAETLSGTFFVGANELGPKQWWDVGKMLRHETPAARFGNLFVFRGTFPNPPAVPARSLYYRAVYGKIYVSEPDIEGGIKMLSESVALDPSAFFVALELGNQYLKIGNHAEALRAYRVAKENAPATDDISELLASQIERVEREPLEQIQPLRNPGLE